MNALRDLVAGDSDDAPLSDETIGDLLENP